MRRYPFERAQPKPTSSETIYIDSDGAEDAVVQPLPKPANPQPMPDIKFPVFQKPDALSQIEFDKKSAPSIADIIFQKKSVTKTIDPDFQHSKSSSSQEPIDPIKFSPNAGPSDMPAIKPIASKSDSLGFQPFVANKNQKYSIHRAETPAQSEAPVMEPISYRESPPITAETAFQSKPKLEAQPLNFRLNNANKPAAPDQLQLQASAQAEVLSPTFTTPSRQSEAPTMAPVSYRESSAPELPSFLKTPAPAPQPIAQEEPEISPIAPPIAQSESQVVKPQEKPPELKMEARQPSQMTDEQIAALFSGVRQAPRVSLLSMPVSTKLFSEEYKDAERL